MLNLSYFVIVVFLFVVVCYFVDLIIQDQMFLLIDDEVGVLINEMQDQDLMYWNSLVGIYEVVVVWCVFFIVVFLDLDVVEEDFCGNMLIFGEGVLIIDGLFCDVWILVVVIGLDVMDDDLIFDDLCLL